MNFRIAAGIGLLVACSVGCSTKSDKSNDTACSGAACGAAGAATGGGGSGGSGGAGATMGGATGAGKGGAGATTGGAPAAGSGGSSATGGGMAGHAGVGVASLCPPNNGYIDSGAELPDGAVLLKGVYTREVLQYLAANDDFFFWAERGTVHKFSIADGSDSKFYEGTSSSHTIEGMAADADTLYFTDAGVDGLGVAKMPIDGSGPPVTLDPDKSTNFCVLAGDNIYYETREGTIARIPKAGGTRTDLVSGIVLGAVRGLMVAGDYLWYRMGNESPGTQIIRVPLDTTLDMGGAGVGNDGLPPAAEAVAPTDYHGAALASDATNVYYGNGSLLEKLPIAGGTATQLATTAGAAILPLSSGIVWTQGGCQDVQRMTPDGTLLEPLLHQAAGDFLAANSKYVFVTIGGQIVRVPRP